jgi:hypothetical protein
VGGGWVAQPSGADCGKCRDRCDERERGTNAEPACVVRRSGPRDRPEPRKGLFGWQDQSLPTSCIPLPNADCELPAARRLLRTSHCFLPSRKATAAAGPISTVSVGLTDRNARRRMGARRRATGSPVPFGPTASAPDRAETSSSVRCCKDRTDAHGQSPWHTTLRPLRGRPVPGPIGTGGVAALNLQLMAGNPSGSLRVNVSGPAAGGDADAAGGEGRAPGACPCGLGLLLRPGPRTVANTGETPVPPAGAANGGEHWRDASATRRNDRTNAHGQAHGTRSCGRSRGAPMPSLAPRKRAPLSRSERRPFGPNPGQTDRGRGRLARIIHAPMEGAKRKRRTCRRLSSLALGL